MIGYADIFYNEAAYTSEQKTEADTALAHIYSSLYLKEKSESRTISEIKRLTADFLVKRISGLSYMDGSVMLYNYVSINNIKETGEISVNPLLTGSGDRVYSVLAKDQNGRITAAIEITFAFDAFITQYTAVGESYDLKSHAVKAYQLLKMTDLDLSKTTAVYLRLNDFLPMYYLTDGTSRYFLTFGSTDKSAGEQYVEWSLDSFNNENRMRVIKSEDLIKIIQNIDTTNMFDRAYDWAPAMGGGEDALSAAAASAESATSIDHSGNSAPASNEAEQTDATALFSNPTLILVILGTVGVILVLLIILFVRRKQYR